MDPLDRLEAERGGQFTIRHDGEVIELPSPLDLSWGAVASLSISGPEAWHRLLPSGTPVWKVTLVRERWLAKFGIPEAEDTRRLLYYLRRYSSAIEVDLLRLPGCEPLATLWQERRWRRLLNAIDHLPRNSFFAEATANDEEHMEMLLRSRESVRSLENRAPSMPFSSFSDEVAVLADVVDGVRQVAIAIIAANSPKGAQTPKFEPYPRPVGADARIKHKIMLEKHERLADRVLARRQKAASN